MVHCWVPVHSGPTLSPLVVSLAFSLSPRSSPPPFGQDEPAPALVPSPSRRRGLLVAILNPGNVKVGLRDPDLV
jgi:hypothetical protein